ncbi:hypothetical protein [Undibacterium sp. RuTC16W]|uniref:hypothetical protein n=1 Tax=Undibacterium sp. RuTC16W TaxID=3413048 RepID=UPI003BF0A236
MKKGIAVAALFVTVLFVVAYLNIGFYSIQPIGAVPTGTTVVVWRKGKEPFFNSPDAMCLLIQNSVSLWCRLTAMGASPKDRIILKLPYQQWAYSISVDGAEFDR